eukprot:10031837-Alexandrium_andersonii.AAC.1
MSASLVGSEMCIRDRSADEVRSATGVRDRPQTRTPRPLLGPNLSLIHIYAADDIAVCRSRWS